jgi:hypothetical protein
MDDLCVCEGSTSEQQKTWAREVLLRLLDACPADYLS